MATGIEFTGGDFAIGSNGFSTANRYIRQVANPADAVMAMVEGPSLMFGPGWRYECGDLVFDYFSTNAGFSLPRLIAL